MHCKTLVQRVGNVYNSIDKKILQVKGPYK